MDRKKIIINEIKYWKKNRLLPEQYCNFLLTLYSEGEETGKEQTSTKSSRLYFLPWIMMTVGLSLLGLTFLVIYFTDFSPPLQIGLIFSFSLLLFFLVKGAKISDRRFVDIYILIGALIIFLAMVHGVSLLFPEQPLAIIFTVLFTCIIWLFFGKKYNLKYLTISGAVGLIISIYFLLFQ